MTENMTRDEYIFGKVWPDRCWHTWVRNNDIDGTVCSKCRQFYRLPGIVGSNPNFSTWPGFGMLLEGMQGHKDWRHFVSMGGVGFIVRASYIRKQDRILLDANKIAPDPFATAVEKWLRDGEKNESIGSL